MKTSITFTFFVLSLFIFACQDASYKDYDDQCANFTCNTTEPFYANINIRFSKSNDYPSPIIYVMTGHYGEGNVFKEIVTDSLNNYTLDIDVEITLNAYYTVYTQYITDEDTVTAIDGDFVYKESYEECGYDCWKTKNTSFDISLKRSAVE